MARYIDADSFLEKYGGWYTEEGAEEGFIGTIKGLVDAQPTLSPDDLRGVVHCKDCKWCHAGYCEKYDDLIPWGCANNPWEDWFCADGKRRETIKEAQDAD